MWIAAPIAGVVASCALPMLSPVAEAKPAELAATLAAHHVHAALVLLYGSLAFGAGLGVSQNPVGVLALSIVFSQPHGNCLAVHLCIADARVSSSCMHVCKRSANIHGLDLTQKVLPAHTPRCTWWLRCPELTSQGVWPAQCIMQQCP